MVIFIINFINIINQFVIAGTKPVITLYSFKLGASPTEIGLIVAVFAFLPAILAVHIGKWIDRIGIKNMVSLGCIIIFVSILLPLIYTNMIMFIFSQALMGIAFTCQVLALQKRVGNGAEDIDKRIATFGLFASFGAMLGPLFSTYMYERLGFAYSYGVNGLLVLFAVAAIYVISRKQWEVSKEKSCSPIETKSDESVWKMLKNKDLRNAVITSGLAISSKEIFSAYFPLLGENMGLSPTIIGIILSIMGATSMIIRMGQHYLVNQFGRGHVLMWSLYISGIIYLLTPISSYFWVLACLVAILGGSLGLGQPLSLAYAIQVSPLERRGEVLGMRITFNRVSQTLIPAVFGGIGGVAGLSIIFVASGVMLLLGGYLTRPTSAATKKA
ncbi:MULTISPECIES: MFS transporter [unclassified Paenibacillus]|uniref:MFS transporter n=1 Tax=unclassified Paenibacillus TaxID=185978 RepID=UPI00362A69E7